MTRTTTPARTRVSDARKATRQGNAYWGHDDALAEAVKRTDQTEAERILDDAMEDAYLLGYAAAVKVSRQEDDR